MRWSFLLFALFAGCHAPPPPPPTTADLHFPVVVLYGNSNMELFANASDLGTMSIGKLNTVYGPPPLIDSQFVIYRLANLSSTHNGLWLMANPTGYTPVKFTLERDPKTGIEVARALFLERLEGQTWRTDLEQRRRSLAAEQTITGMLGLLQRD